MEEKMKSNALLLAALAMSGNSFIAHGGGDDMFVSRIKSHSRPAKPPNGTKEYWFNQQGEFSTTGMKRDEIAFKCVAINDKNAIRKFNRFINPNT
jgi:hypothetical protein